MKADKSPAEEVCVENKSESGLKVEKDLIESEIRSQMDEFMIKSGVDDEPYVDPDPKDELSELTEAYKDDNYWGSFKKRMDAIGYGEALELIRCFLADDWDEFMSDKKATLFDWVNYRKSKYGDGHYSNDHFSRILMLATESHGLCGFYRSAEFSGFREKSKQHQRETLFELFCDYSFLNCLGIFVRRVESPNYGELDYMGIWGIIPSNNRTGFFMPDINMINLIEGHEFAKDFRRTELSKSELAGFNALYCFGMCVLFSYRHYCHQENAKTKFNRTAARLEDEAISYLIAGQEFCYRALGDLSYKLLDENRKEADIKISKLKARSSTGGKKAASLPDEYFKCFDECLKDILQEDSEQLLRISDVSELLANFMNQSGSRGLFEFPWKPHFSREPAWCKEQIKGRFDLSVAHEYLTKSGKPSKRKKALMTQIKVNVGIT